MKLSSATRTTVVAASLFGWPFMAHAAPNTSLYEASRACNGERDATDDQIIEGCSIVLQYGSAAFGGVKGAYVNRAFAYRSQGRCDLALADFDKAISMRANKASVHRGRGSVYLCLKRYDEALADFNTAIEKEPDSAWSYFYRGKTYLAQGDRVRAQADFDQAVKLDPAMASRVAKALGG